MYVLITRVLDPLLAHALKLAWRVALVLKSRSCNVNSVGRLALLCGLLLCAVSAQAATKYWIGGTAGDFNDNSRWSTTSGGANDTTAPGSTDVATFDGSGLGSATITTNLDVDGINILAGYTGTLTQNSGVTLTVGASAFNQAGGIFVGSNATIDVNDSFTLSGGAFTSTSGSLFIARHFTLSGGTFTHNSGTIVINGIVDQNITSGGNSFNHLVLNNTGPAFQDDIIIADALDINGDLTITSGWLDLDSNNPAVNTAGNVTVQTNGFVYVGARTANWTFDGTSILTDSSSGGTQDLQDVVVNGTSLTLASNAKVETLTVTSGTLNLGGSGYVLEIDGTGTPLSNSGTFTAGTSTVKYTGTGSATNSPRCLTAVCGSPRLRLRPIRSLDT